MYSYSGIGSIERALSYYSLDITPPPTEIPVRKRMFFAVSKCMVESYMQDMTSSLARPAETCSLFTGALLVRKYSCGNLLVPNYSGIQAKLFWQMVIYHNNYSHVFVWVRVGNLCWRQRLHFFALTYEFAHRRHHAIYRPLKRKPGGPRIPDPSTPANWIPDPESRVPSPESWTPKSQVPPKLILDSIELHGFWIL